MINIENEKDDENEEIENEEEVFKERSEWFKELFSDKSGFISNKDRLHAIENARKLSKVTIQGFRYWRKPATKRI